MARITVEDCLKRTSNRFLLVNMTARRVRQIREGSEYLVSSPKNEDIVVALREIAAGKFTLDEEPEEALEAITEETEAGEETAVEEAAEEDAAEAETEEGKKEEST